MRVLLIDDSAAYHEEFSLILADAGVQYSALDFVTTAEEGRRLLGASAHDIYFVDFRMPAENGLTLVREARRSGLVKPVIVLTAFDNPEVDAAAAGAGANDYLRKGDFSPALLGRSIRYARRNAAAVEAARAAELRFAMAQEAADIGTWEWNVARNTFVWSPRQYANFGFDPSMQGPIDYDMWRSAIHVDDRQSVEAAMMASLAKHTPFSATFRVMVADRGPHAKPSNVHWLSAKGRVVRDGFGRPTHMIGVSIDITEQQNALNAVRDSRNLAMAGLQSSESRFQAYFDSAPESLFQIRIAPDGRFIYETVNPAGLARTGLTLEMTRGRTPQEVMGPEAGAIITEGLRRVVETGAPYLYEPTFQMASGSTIFDAIYMPIFDAHGAVTGVLGSARDVTERRRLEATLLQAQKMEALGQLASGVAHDFNNVLTGTLGCLELLGKHVTSEKGKKLISEGQRTVERGAHLTARLLAFSRQQPLAAQSLDVNISIGEMSDLLERTLPGVRVTKHLSPGLWRAVADRNQLELAILNLAINARDAMPTGGSVTVETRNETISTPQPDELAPGNYVAITLSDTGSGMPPEILARALDPFFTTKEPGKGTGLGLSMVYGTVRQLGGGMRIASELGHGTTITLFLPCADIVTNTLPSPPVVPEEADILLVADDIDTRLTVTAYAAELNLTVAMSATAAQALAQLDQGGQFRLLICDAYLTAKTEPNFPEAVQSRRPGLNIITLCTQQMHAPAEKPQPGAIPLAGHPKPNTGLILAKPFGRDAFNRAVMQCISPATPGNVIRLFH